MPIFAAASGCRFSPRCQFAGERCDTEDPPVHDFGNHHVSACWLAQERFAATTEKK
jgi:oligopeptide/dipeptide ABC transporter ATP-binding protein